MTSKDWLKHLASLMAHRLPGNAAHLSAYAGQLAAGVPARWLTTSLAEAVEPHMLDRMKGSELLALVRREGNLLPPEAGGAAPERTSGQSIADEGWFNLACASLADKGERHLDHLLSLLRTYSPAAWERFAEIHAPEVLAARREQVAELMARRRGDLPRLGVPGVPAVAKPIPSVPRSRHAMPAPAPTRKPSPTAQRQADTREDNRLRILADAGDEMAAYRLAFRQEQRAQPEMAR